MMKKFKNILSLVLAILLLLTACGTVPPDPTNTEQTKPSETEETVPDFATRPVATEPDPATAEMNISRQCFPQTIDNPDNLPVLKWVCFPERTSIGGSACVWNEEASIELNQMLADRNMPFRVQFVVYKTDYVYTMNWLVRPEVKEDLDSADLIFINQLPADQAKNYFMPLTNYIRGTLEPSLKNAVPHKINWLQTTGANNEIYAIPMYLRYPESACWVVDSDVMTEYGLTISDFQKDYWELDDTLKKLNEASGKRKLIEIEMKTTEQSFYNPATNVSQVYPGIAGKAMEEYFTAIGAIYAVEYVNGDPKVVNTLDTEKTYNIRDAVIRYKEKYAAGDWNSAKVYISQGYGQQPYLTNDTSTLRDYYEDSSREQWHIPITSASYNASPNVYMQDCSGVSVSSEHQKDAVSLLSLIAEDEEFRMQLLFGKEGRDYTIDENGNYYIVRQEDGTTYNMSFLSPWSHFSGMKGNTYPGTAGVYPQYEGKTVLETYLEIVENAEPYYKVPFDLSGLEAEVQAVKQVCQLYFYRFASLTEEKYAEMLSKINAAGGEKILKELQKQLDIWALINPGKAVAPRS